MRVSTRANAGPASGRDGAADGASDGLRARRDRASDRAPVRRTIFHAVRAMLHWVTRNPSPAVRSPLRRIRRGSRSAISGECPSRTNRMPCTKVQSAGRWWYILPATCSCRRRERGRSRSRLFGRVPDREFDRPGGPRARGSDRRSAVRGGSWTRVPAECRIASSAGPTCGTSARATYGAAQRPSHRTTDPRYRNTDAIARTRGAGVDGHVPVTGVIADERT